MTPEQRRRYTALAPWKQPVGGDAGDLRADLCIAHFGPELGRVLELSCLEGGHTYRLARKATSLLALEGRPGNVQRTELTCELADVTNVEVRLSDLETADLLPLGKFDTVFCCGLLYHLEDPGRLLEQISKVTTRLFLWSHYTPDPLPDQRMNVVEVNGQRGRWQTEDGNSTTSGMGEKAWWYTRSGLLKALTEAGLEKQNVLAENPWDPWDPYLIVACEHCETPDVS